MKTTLISRDILYTGKFTGVRDLIEFDGAKRFHHETILHPGAVVMLPILPDGRLMCVKQYRHSVERELLEFPAGTLEAGEIIEDAAARELEEEIGFFPRDLILLGSIFPAPGFSNEVQHFFVARDLVTSVRPPDEDEFIELCPLTISECQRLIVSGEMCDAKSIAIFAKAVLSGHIKYGEDSG